MGAGELFLSGITACAVNMVEGIADAENILLDWMDVSAESYRDPDKTPGEITVYDDVRIHFQMWGVADDQGQYLVEMGQELAQEYAGRFLEMPREQAVAELGVIGLERMLAGIRLQMERLGVTSVELQDIYIIRP